MTSAAVAPLNGGCPVEHLEEQHAEREQIGAGVEVAAARLFGRHVVERAHHDAVPGLDELRGIVLDGCRAASPISLASPKSSTFT